MKKYMYIFKSEIMSSLQYVFNVITHLISFFIMLFIFMNLWTYIYDDPSELINGYNRNQMVWYVICTEMIWFTVGGRKACRKIIADVKTGNIAYNINKPYNYVLYSLASHLGEIFVGGIIYIGVGLVIGYSFMGEIPCTNLLSLLAILVTFCISVAINTLFVIFIGLFSFFIEDSGPMYWIYSKFILVLGSLFPIEFFPAFMQGFLKFSPIYVMQYGPARLFIMFDSGEFVKLIIAQVIYIGIAYALCSMVYKKGVRRLNVNGG